MTDTISRIESPKQAKEAVESDEADPSRSGLLTINVFTVARHLEVEFVPPLDEFGDKRVEQFTNILRILGRGLDGDVIYFDKDRPKSIQPIIGDMAIIGVGFSKSQLLEGLSAAEGLHVTYQATR